MLTLANIGILYKKYGYLPFIRPMRSIVSDVQTIHYNSDATLLQRLNTFIRYATLHTPYYHHKKEYHTLSRLEDINQLPLLKKQLLKNRTDLFYSKQSTFFNTVILKTSGTTGSPMTIKVNIKDLQLRFNLLLKAMVAFGYDPQKPLARISGKAIATQEHIYRKDYINGHIFLSAFHLSQESITHYYRAILDNNIEALEGYPSVIYTMAKLFEYNHLKVDTIKHIFTTAEKLHDYQKQTIESVFNCKVCDYYGSNEQSIFIFTCKNGRLHTSNATALLEVLDTNGNPVKPGEVGRMVITSFTSHFMPLIRYDIGDHCIISEDQRCSCGSGGTIIQEIIGRDEDIFKTDNGTYITRFSVVLKTLPSPIIESQLLLRRHSTTITLYYCAPYTLHADAFKTFQSALYEKVGPHYDLEIIKVDTITKNPQGKTKAVIIEN